MIQIKYHTECMTSGRVSYVGGDKTDTPLPFGPAVVILSALNAFGSPVNIT